MKKLIRELLSSKKFVTSMLGVATVLAMKLGIPETRVTEMLAILSPFLAYVGAQGLADLGKESAAVSVAAAAPKPSGGGAS